MALFGFGKKKAVDVLDKQFKDLNISLDYKDGRYSFELVLPAEGYSLYPYFVLNEETKELSVVINLREAGIGLTLIEYDRMNQFNVKSKFLTAKLSSEGVIFLEYNAKVDTDKVRDVLAGIIESVFMLSKEIDAL